MIDWAVLNGFRDEIGPEAMDAVFAAFRDDTALVLARLRVDVHGAATARALRLLEASALNLGFTGFAAACAEAERAAASGALEHAMLDRLRVAFAATIDAYRRGPSGG